MHEAIDLVDPVLEGFSVVIDWVIVRLRHPARQSVGTVRSPGNMAQLEMEGEDVEDPAIHAGARGNVGVAQHAFDVLRVDLDDQVPTPDEVQLVRTKRPIKSALVQPL